MTNKFTIGSANPHVELDVKILHSLVSEREVSSSNASVKLSLRAIAARLVADDMTVRYRYKRGWSSKFELRTFLILGTILRLVVMLQIKELVVSYGKRSDGPVLKGVDIQLNKEKAVIVGPNGSGKSTLFKAVLGLATIKGGSVKVFETDVASERNDLRISTNIADVYRLAYVKIQDILKIFAELKRGNPEEALKLIGDFELNSILNKRIHELSTGQAKMFGNIMAVSFQPKLVLLDEPFDNVDESRRRRFIEVLKGLDSGMIIITHEFNLLPRLGDWGLYFMLEGKLWGKFQSSQLDRLYVTRGEATDALKVMDTSLGKLSVTLDHGDIAVKTVSNVNALLDQV